MVLTFLRSKVAPKCLELNTSPNSFNIFDNFIFRQILLKKKDAISKDLSSLNFLRQIWYDKLFFGHFYEILKENISHAKDSVAKNFGRKYENFCIAFFMKFRKIRSKDTFVIKNIIKNLR